MNDLRYAFRQLLKNPGFTAVAVLTLALGIGANTALFSVIRGVLLKPLPYREPDRLVAVCESNPRQGWNRYVTSLGAFVDWRADNPVFEELAGALVLGPTPLVGEAGSQMIHAASVSANLFPLLGIQPLLGRPFLPEEETPGSGDVVLLSEGLWRDRFAADPGIVNRPVVLGDRTFTVVGVMPAKLRLFEPAGIQGWDSGFSKSDLWRPLPVRSGLAKQRNYRAFLVVGRLAPKVTLARARAEMTRLAAEQARRYPDSNAGWGISVVALDDLVVGPARRPLLLLFGAVGFVLLIATANLANLSLGRAAARHREMTVRMALGAGRFRMVRPWLTESLLLAGLGGGAGLLLAHGSLRLLVGLIPATVPRSGEIGLDAWVLGFTFLTSLCVGGLFGLAPVLGLWRRDLNLAWSQEARGSTDGRSGHRLRATLVVAQVALMTVLLTGAGLLLRSFWTLSAVHPGFRPEQVIAADVSFNGLRYTNGWERIAATQALLARLAGHPSDGTFAAVDGLPLDRGRANMDIAWTSPDAGSGAPTEEQRIAGLRLASPGYFGVMGIPLLRGRVFVEHDNTNAPPVVIINESLARKYFPGVDPLGRRIASPDFGSVPCEVVGIVQDVRHSALDAPPQPEAYRPLFQQCFSGVTVVVRGPSSSVRRVDAVRDVMAAVDRNCPVYNVRSLEWLVGESLASRRFALWLMQLFAGLSLLLAMVGVYGVLSCVVVERTREIGIRLAVGAQRGDVVGLVLRHGLRSVVLGGALGLAGAYGLSRVLRSLLFGVSPTDPLTFAVACLLMVCVAMLACWIPALRAARVDPMVVLRAE